MTSGFQVRRPNYSATLPVPSAASFNYRHFNLLFQTFLPIKESTTARAIYYRLPWCSQPLSMKSRNHFPASRDHPSNGFLDYSEKQVEAKFCIYVVYAEVTYLYHSLVNHLSRYTLFTNANICQRKDMQLNLIKKKLR